MPLRSVTCIPERIGASLCDVKPQGENGLSEPDDQTQSAEHH